MYFGTDIPSPFPLCHDLFPPRFSFFFFFNKHNARWSICLKVTLNLYDEVISLFLIVILVIFLF